MAGSDLGSPLRSFCGQQYASLPCRGELIVPSSSQSSSLGSDSGPPSDISHDREHIRPNFLGFGATTEHWKSPNPNHQLNGVTLPTFKELMNTINEQRQVTVEPMESWCLPVLQSTIETPMFLDPIPRRTMSADQKRERKAQQQKRRRKYGRTREPRERFDKVEDIWLLDQKALLDKDPTRHWNDILQAHKITFPKQSAYRGLNGLQSRYYRIRKLHPRALGVDGRET